MDDKLQFKLLVSCVNDNGGLYNLEWKHGDYTLTKIISGSFRGIAQCGEHFIVVMERVILKLDQNFNVLRGVRADNNAEFHGVFIQNGKAYIVETELNSIGIYDLANLSRTGEILFMPAGEDFNHINDLYMDNDTILFSMFTIDGKWRSKPENCGVILSYNLEHCTIDQVLFKSLHRPHSVIRHKGHIYYCNSSKFEVKRDEETIFHADGFTRGLAIVDRFLFVGQSYSRLAGGKICDCGIHMIDLASHTSTFIPVPSVEVYGILPYR